jgi:DNA-binding NarL/FixJ family response regulator
MSGDSPPWTVVIVDDHHLVRGGLRLAFDRAEDLEVVGEAGSVAEALAALEKFSPDVLVTDVGLPDGDGIALVRGVRKDQPKLGIVVVTMYTSDKELFGALESGASAFVGKDAPAHEVVAAARHSIVSPEMFIAPGLAEAIKRRMQAPEPPPLSPRELEVLELLVNGLAIRQIARRLFISESTAKTHVASIYQKLGVGNRAQAVVTAFSLGLVRRPGSDGDGPRYQAR